MSASRASKRPSTDSTMPKTLTPAQEQAIDHPGAPILQDINKGAGAGSGKTEVLAQRAVRLFTDRVEPASLIAFTFTEKAAGELKERIELRAPKETRAIDTSPRSAAACSPAPRTAGPFRISASSAASTRPRRARRRAGLGAYTPRRPGVAGPSS
jgi:hypothetical protein